MIQVNPPLLDEFLNSLGHSTSIQYRRDIERFSEFTNHQPIESIPMALCLQYKASMAELAANTVNRRLNSVRSYFEFLRRYGSLQVNPMTVVNRAKGAFNPTNVLDDDEVNRILETTTNPMHLAVLGCLFYLGLRRSEVCKLRILDMSSSGIHSTLRVQGKGSKQRMLPIPSNLQTMIQNYLYSSRGSIWVVDEPIFISGLNEGKDQKIPLHSNTITQIFKAACRRAKITKRVSPHSARVTAVSNAIENGANLSYVQQMGGWSTLDMVSIYNRRKEELKNSATYKINYGPK